MNQIVTLSVEDSVTEQILTCFDRYKYNKDNLITNIEEVSTVNGIQTENALELKDFQQDLDFNESLSHILNIIHSKTFLNLSYYYVHFVEYDRGGYQIAHNHAHAEDYSCVLYLNTCEGGETYFDDVSFAPTKGNMIIFPSYLNHGSKETRSFKTVLVLGMRKCS